MLAILRHKQLLLLLLLISFGILLGVAASPILSLIIITVPRIMTSVTAEVVVIGCC